MKLDETPRVFQEQIPNTTPEGEFPTHIYRPLSTTIDSIRLLVLHPRRSNEQPSIVRCHLICTTFFEKPIYEALSYTWGNPTPTINIILDDVVFPVRENLYSALYTLRGSVERILWADAICIDQSNLKERKYQVGLMDFLYNRASWVLIWLGWPPFPIDHPLDAESYFDDPDRMSQDSMGWWFCTHDYWSRLWVIQEVCLSIRLRVCCGDMSWDWNDFTRGLSWREAYKQKGLNIKTLDDKRKGRNEESNNLEFLMEAFQYAKCVEIRDKVYGFLGLANDIQDGYLEADYERSLFDLYVDVLRVFCSRRLLSNAQPNGFDRSMRLVRFSQLVQRLFQTPSLPINLMSSHLAVVQVTGLAVGKIHHLGPSFSDIIASKSSLKEWRATIEHFSLHRGRECLREADKAHFSELLDTSIQDLWKYCDINPQEMYSRADPGHLHYRDDEEDWESGELAHHMNRDLHDVPNISKPQRSYSGPRIFLGGKCIMGLAPANSKAGDVICRFWKTDVTALLRQEGNSEVWRVVGKIRLFHGWRTEVQTTGEYLEGHLPHNDLRTTLIQMNLMSLSVLTC